MEPAAGTAALHPLPHSHIPSWHQLTGIQEAYLLEEAVSSCFWSFPTVRHLKCSDLTYLGDYILALLPVTIWGV